MTTVSAKATFANAIREPSNRINLLAFLLGTFAGVMKLLSAWLGQDSGAALFGLALTVLGIVAGSLYFRYMLSIFFEFTDESFRYEEDWRKLSFAWKDIEAVKIEPRKKRLTVWVHGKPRPMHYFGVADSEFDQMKQFLLTKLSEYGIPQK